jgi:hypothetical protein
MKKSAPYIILFVLALLIWNAIVDAPGGMHMDINGEDFDGPLGGIAAVLLASGGILIGIVVAALVAVILAVVFAGVGIVVVAALALAAAVAALAVSPLLLPVLIPVAIIWYVARRNRHRALPVDPKAQTA